MTSFVVEITCDRHGVQTRVIDTFEYAERIDGNYEPTGRFEWFWRNDLKTGHGGKLDPSTGLGDWHHPEPSHGTVRSDFTDSVPRLELRCHGHGDVGMTWSEFIERYLEPCRANGVHTVPLKVIDSIQKNPTTRRRG